MRIIDWRMRNLIEFDVDTGQEGFEGRKQLTFEFKSHDIGMTQGTTLLYQGEILAQYKPHTGHWDRALEIAEKVLRMTLEYVAATELTWDLKGFRKSISYQLVGENCTPWDGEDLDPDW